MEKTSLSIQTFKKARFHFLTANLVRLEYSASGQFEDGSTFAVPRQSLVASKKNTVPSAVKIQIRRIGAWVCMESECLRIEYLEDGKIFHAKNLRIIGLTGMRFKWHPGLSEKANLGGTFRTLDGYDGAFHVKDEIKDTKALDPGKGFISTEGWALYDDSNTLVLDTPSSPCEFKEWVRPRPKEHLLDLYFFGHGKDYLKALGDASKLFGPQALPPRYAFGYWFSRDFVNTDSELRELVQRFQELKIPLDVMVLDMDWHIQGWTGYTWDKNLFPNPKKFLSWLHEQGLKVCLNLHPADGVSIKENAYEKMRLELQPEMKKKATIPFDCSDSNFMQAYFRHLHHPLMRDGVDFWWMDWQQGTEAKLKGLDPLPWLNRLHWEDLAKTRKNIRPLSFSRYGGAGSGRYPVGFSGDAFSTWDSLAYQVEVTPRASNALFGYWSHDIGGYLSKDFSPELYVRWMQFGLYSPILRTHVAKHGGSDRRFWTLPEPYAKYLRLSALRRLELLPYIYTEARNCFDTGLSLLQPMYYHWPQHPKAYNVKEQYYFGKDIVVAPIIHKKDEVTELAKATFWLPPGKWIDSARGEILQGDCRYQRSYLEHEIPVFRRPGSILPTQRGQLQNQDGSYKNLCIEICPGGNGSYNLYEDDGISESYQENLAWYIPLRYEQKGTTGKFRMEPLQGKAFKGSQTTRNMLVTLSPCIPPQKITLNGKELRYNPTSKSVCWNWDANACLLTVNLGRMTLTKPNTLDFTWETEPSQALNGFKGWMSRLSIINEWSKFANIPRPFFEKDLFPSQVALTGLRMTYEPNTWKSEYKQFKKELPKLLPLLMEYLASYQQNNKTHKNPLVIERRAPRLLALKKAIAMLKQSHRAYSGI